jgi:hypothetical protein
MDKVVSNSKMELILKNQVQAMRHQEGSKEYRHSGESGARSFSAVDSRSWFFRMPDQVRYDGALWPVKFLS